MRCIEEWLRDQQQTEAFCYTFGVCVFLQCFRAWVFRCVGTAPNRSDQTKGETGRGLRPLRSPCLLANAKPETLEFGVRAPGLLHKKLAKVARKIPRQSSRNSCCPSPYKGRKMERICYFLSQFGLCRFSPLSAVGRDTTS